MKRILVVLLSLGLVMAFSMSASAAVDVKFSGMYYAQGWYVSNHELADTDKDSRALINQRLRVETVFGIAEGLTLTTRFDALEKKWGDQTWKGGSEDVASRWSQGAAGIRTMENIEFEHSYVTAATKIGIFKVGYQQAGLPSFGTSFLNSDYTVGGITYILPGPLTLVLGYEKHGEYIAPGTIDAGAKDGDADAYAIAGVYKLPAGEAGIVYGYFDVATNKPSLGFRTPLHVFDGYVKNTWGPLYAEAEAYYIGGKWMQFDADSPIPHTDDMKAQIWGAYAKVNYNMGPAYAGGLFAFMSGDDPNTSDKQEGGIMSTIKAGKSFAPCLILYNYGYHLTIAKTPHLSLIIDNILLGQIYAGFKPIPKMDVKASVTYAKADQKPLNYVADEYGTEVDITATYKIFDNLSYMVGAAYLKAGDYFKGADASKKIGDNYLLTHNLVLIF